MVGGCCEVNAVLASQHAFHFTLEKDMGFYDNIINEEVIKRELVYKGHKQDVYFRRLTAGERIAVSRGQRMMIGNKSKENGVEVDLGDALERTQKFLMYSNVDATGTRIFRKLEDVQKLPEDLVTALQRIADEAFGEPEVEAGNVSSKTTD